MHIEAEIPDFKQKSQQGCKIHMQKRAKKGTPVMVTSPQLLLANLHINRKVTVPHVRSVWDLSEPSPQRFVSPPLGSVDSLPESFQRTWKLHGSIPNGPPTPSQRWTFERGGPCASESRCGIETRRWAY